MVFEKGHIRAKGGWWLVSRDVGDGSALWVSSKMGLHILKNPVL